MKVLKYRQNQKSQDVPVPWRPALLLFWHAELSDLHLYIENNTDIPVDFSLNDLSFNDKMINAGMYQTVYPGGKRITSTYINKENLKKYKLTDLEDIKNIEFTVKGTQKGDYREIFSTGPLKAENP